MSKVRDAISAEVTKKVSQHALVIWQDTEGEYADVAQELSPSGTTFVRYDGSWYGLRHTIDAYLAGEQPPKLLVYVPAAKPTHDDPLLEVRKSGHEFTRRLPTLVRDALKGELSEQRIAELTTHAKTLPDVEIALANGGGADVRLVRILKTTDTHLMALRVFKGELDSQLTTDRAWDAVASMLNKQFGGETKGSGDELRGNAARQLFLSELEVAMDGLPAALQAARLPAPADQLRRTSDLLARWRADGEYRASYVHLAREIDDVLQLVKHIEWKAGLAGCVTTPSIETIVFRHALKLLDSDAWEDAAKLAAARFEKSLWCRADAGDDQWAARNARWRVVEAIAKLRAVLVSVPAPAGDRSADVFSWYADKGWQVDQAHRLYELTRVELDAYGDLDAAINAARAAYETWLEDVLLATSKSIESSGVDPGALSRQGEIHDKWVRGGDEPAAYIWVDAMRYELGQTLVDQLRGVVADVSIHAAVGAAPTITPVGMANLAPSADTRLSLAVDAGKLVVRLDGTVIATVADRVNQLRGAHGDRVANLTLDDVVGQSEKELRRAIGNARVVIVRSTEIDAQGESGMLQAAWPSFAQLVQLLVRAIARLGHAGVRRIVVTADHGFIVLPRGLGADRSIDVPSGGTGELHRRVWIGNGGVSGPSTLRVALASTGTPGDLDLVVPRGLAVFKGQGSKQFFHGGLSPQELIVPVVVAGFAEVEATPKLSVKVTVAGGRVTTGMFAATIEFGGDLFTSEITVRAVAQGTGAGKAVARVVSGDGFDSATGIITLRRDTSPVLAFQMTANVDKDDVVRVEVLDARTGLSLGFVDVAAAARIVVEEDLI